MMAEGDCASNLSPRVFLILKTCLSECGVYMYSVYSINIMCVSTLLCRFVLCELVLACFSAKKTFLDKKKSFWGELVLVSLHQRETQILR